MDAFSLDFLSESMTGNVSHMKTHKFYIVQTMALASSRISTFAETAAKDYDMHLLPWASVAACISDDSHNDDVIKLGRAFCFLPLPVKTGLHVHINGYFEVSSNRRGIWYGDDMDRSGRIRSVWNKLLLEDVVAPSFAKLLLGMQSLLGPTKHYYSLWPVGSFEDPWNSLVEHIYRNISGSPVLYSDVEDGKWISPEEAFLHDMDISGSKELGDILAQLGMPIVHLPNNLYNMLLNCKSGVHQKVVTPDSVRHYLRRCKFTNAIDRFSKLMLLEYCLEDLIDNNVGTDASGLPLIPLANDPRKGSLILFATELEYELLQQISDRLVDRSIPLHLLSRLTAIAKVSGANLVIFSSSEFVPLFSKFVPAEWKYKKKVHWDPNSNCTHPNSSWFVLFWRYLREQCEKLYLFEDWPILPSLSGHLCKPSRQEKLLNVENLSNEMQHVLVKIGCKILNTNYCVEHSDLFHYMYDADGAGVLDSIFDVLTKDGICQLLQCLQAEERDVLRRFLLDPTWYVGKQMDDSHIENCKWLPIYRVYGGEAAENSNYSDLVNPRKHLPPSDCPECLFCGEFIYNLSNTEEEMLSRYYGIERMRKTQFLQAAYFT
ncbi:zinc finger protein [Forsythia ovata]|uniref:Zinc finger protein n=1 Tax=Forsythia ovata TaxID=205694 RepID=A0ABD1SJY8_9LAMI